MVVYLTEPEDFKPLFEVVSCFLECNGRILLLLRQDSKQQANTWCVPGGKIEKGEDAYSAILREIFEESGVFIARERLLYFRKVFVRYPDFDFVYHIFSAKTADRDAVVINPEEHKEHQWVLPETALKMPLIMDEDECIKMFYRI